MDIQQEILRQANLELAKRDFFHYCHMMMPKFFKYDRDYLRELTSEMQSFLEGNDNVLVVNIPPRHGKSLTATKFVEWMLGNDIDKKVMTGSYNEKLSTNFAKAVRNTIMELKADEDITVYNDIFPNTRIKRGDASNNLWALEGAYNTYLATSPTGTATGFGASVIIIDDLIKNDYEASNINILEGHWEWFTNTMISRLEDGGKIVIIMTRWHSEDLAGKALKEMPKMGFKVKHVNMKAEQEDGTMLCEEILSKHDYAIRKKALGAHIASANYQQEPIDLVGKLYKEFKTWDEFPKVTTGTKMYVDTADTGQDFLSSVIYDVDKTDNVFVKDFVHTQEPMEITEDEVAKKIVQYEVTECVIESNNGGRGFKRSVEKKVKELGYHKCKFVELHQTKNKEARILSNATTVNELVHMPPNWKITHPEVYEFFNKYQRSGKNKHDDMADAITGVVERLSQPKAKVVVGGKIHGRRR